jgi:hypothetical protein
MNEARLEKEIELTRALLCERSLWDGYWIVSFDKGLLTIAASFDRIYYRDVELRFFSTTYFDLPEKWSDTSFKPLPNAQWFRLSSYEELYKAVGVANDLPEDPLDLPDSWGASSVFAIELLDRTAFIAASYFEAFRVVVGDGGRFYTDPLPGDHRNKVPLLSGER